VRFATWNCRSEGSRKILRLESAGVDLAVVCEAPIANPRPSPTLTDSELSWHSVGLLPFKALAVVGLTAPVVAVEPDLNAGRWCLLAHSDGGPSVLAIWSCPSERRAAAYAEQVIRSLDAHADLLVEGRVLVAGDFNVGQAMSDGNYTDWVAPVRERWESLGLVSVYHSFFHEPIGQATRATYYHQCHQNQGFHIDYVLIHRSRLPSVKAVAVGTFEEWVASGLSDHVPIVVDLDW
jgi:hypothetical protein